MYKPIYDRASGFKKIGEIFTWIFLLFLIPSTALGYFAEQSVPGQPLFPIKLTIEHLVLGLQSFNPEAQASYQVSLVNKRFDEVQTLLTKDTTNAGDLNNFGLQLQAATQYINSLPPSTEKVILQQKLTSNIKTYQEQIKVQQQIVENKAQIFQYQTSGNGSQGIPNFRMPPPPPLTATPTLIPNNNLTKPNFDNTPTPFPTYTPYPTPPDNNNQDYEALNQALLDMQNQLNNAQFDLSSNSFMLVNPTPTRAPSGTPTPTITPRPPTPTTETYQYVAPTQYVAPYSAPYSGSAPRPTPTPTPYTPHWQCSNFGGRCISDNDAYFHCLGGIYKDYNWPTSCSQSYPVCCTNYQK